ncbi:MAG TPA: SPOR domain-containing protein, partial [Allosphingosinicella sp.]|nr:SPOR domain-containing protein [Allosphingosinicella sp.]
MSDDARTEELGEEDRLPWLEAVEEEDEREGPSVAKLVGAILIGLVAIGLIVGGLFWLGNRDGAGGSGDGELIAAPEGDYKVRPDDPGGMNVAGEGDTAYAASEGAEPKGRLNTQAVPERPVT